MNKELKEFIARFNYEKREETMRFKVGDRVRYSMGIGWEFGTILVAQESGITGKTSYIVQQEGFTNSEWCDEDTLELVQPETQDPIPGKYYRTRGGDKVFYVGKSKNDYFIYQAADGEFENYSYPFKYLFDDEDGSYMDIVGEWVDSPESQIDEVVLPAVEIKRWAVVSTKSQSSGYRRGLVPHICESIENAKELLAEARKCYDDFEIVELTGVLPERKVGKC